MQSIKGQVREFIGDNLMLGGHNGDFADDASFLDMGLIDSTGVIELISFLEERFGIQVYDEEIIPDNLDSVQRVEAFVLRKLVPQASSKRA